MKRIFLFYLITLVIMITLCHCSVNPSNALIDVPYPRTLSIIPLIAKSSWIFSHTVHDSSGTITAPLHLKIDRVYGLKNDTDLVLITELTIHQKFPLYLYEYEWNELEQGMLISYRDTNVDTTGIYIHGEYKGEEKILYPTPILWLKYPVKAGDTWIRYSKNTSDTVAFHYEVIDVKAIFSIPTQKNNSISPVDFISCHLFKETKGNRTSYFYYNPTFGSVGFIEYKDGLLKRTYQLSHYSH